MLYAPPAPNPSARSERLPMPGATLETWKLLALGDPAASSRSSGMAPHRIQYLGRRQGGVPLLTARRNARRRQPPVAGMRAKLLRELLRTGPVTRWTASP